MGEEKDGGTIMYGFNEDKSKAPILELLEITPNDGETYGNFRMRVWYALDAIPKGHIFSIFFRINNDRDYFMPLTLPQYMDNGHMYSMMNLCTNDSREESSGVNFKTFAFASNTGELTNHFYRSVFIKPDGVTETNAGREKDMIVNEIDAGMKMKIYYMP